MWLDQSIIICYKLKFSQNGFSYSKNKSNSEEFHYFIKHKLQISCLCLTLLENCYQKTKNCIFQYPFFTYATHTLHLVIIPKCAESFVCLNISSTYRDIPWLQHITIGSYRYHNFCYFRILWLYLLAAIGRLQDHPHCGVVCGPHPHSRLKTYPTTTISTQ